MFVASPSRRRASVLVALFVALACSDANIIGPENQLEVANNTDTFQWQVSALDNVSQTIVYSWQMTGTTANVNQSGSLAGGSATITVRDLIGTQVYAKSLGETGTFTTTAGTAGTWTIQVELDGATGTLRRCQ